jgi:hypothetical protein
VVQFLPEIYAIIDLENKQKKQFEGRGATPEALEWIGIL